MKKTYERDFKIEVSKQIAKNLTTVTEVATEYNISRPIVSRWVSEYNRYGNKAFSGKGKRLPDRAKLHVLEAENKLLKEENEILKKFEVFVKRQKQ